MDSFQSKIGWRRPRKRDKENYRSAPFIPVAKQKIPKKIVKKFKKLINTIMASFQAKIGWIRQIKRKTKNCRAVSFPYDV